MNWSLVLLYIISISGWIACSYAIWSWRESIKNLIRFASLRYEDDD